MAPAAEDCILLLDVCFAGLVAKLRPKLSSVKAFVVLTDTAHMHRAVRCPASQAGHSNTCARSEASRHILSKEKGGTAPRWHEHPVSASLPCAAALLPHRGACSKISARQEAAGLGPALCYDEVLEAEREGLPGFRWVRVGEDDGCGLCYTSGTTGRPKVTRQHRAV